MMNLGARPTFGEIDRTLEVHLFDATGDWYGDARAGRVRSSACATPRGFRSPPTRSSQQLGRDARARSPRVDASLRQPVNVIGFRDTSTYLPSRSRMSNLKYRVLIIVGAVVWRPIWRCSRAR